MSLQDTFLAEREAARRKREASQQFRDWMNVASFAPMRTTLQQIVHECATEAGVTVGDVLGQARTSAIIKARHKAVYRALCETGLSTIQIGRGMGGKDHSSIIHAAHSYCVKNGLKLPRGMVTTPSAKKKLARKIS